MSAASSLSSASGRHWTGCEQIQLVTTAQLLGVRDTRRIIGEFELRMEDYTARWQFPDQVAVYNRPQNVHPTDNSQQEAKRHRSQLDEDLVRLGRGECVGLPPAHFPSMSLRTSARSALRESSSR